MPADYEMLVSHSPPVYNNYLSDYSAIRFNREISRFSTRTCRSMSTNSFLFAPKNCNPTSAVPRRPCLVIRPEDANNSSDEDPTSPVKLKKKVVFADDRGMSLTHVRIMTEPSNVPPLLTSRFLAEVTQGLSANPVSGVDRWEIMFAQPAADYLEFRRKLDSEKVSLENVIIKDSEELVWGTIKVRNISFEKDVVVRCTTDGWKTHENIFCKYMSNSSGSSVNSAYVLYDTFSFKIPLPLKANRIEFCICYRSAGEEFWDNNSQNNYVLVKKMYHETFALKELNNNNTIQNNDCSKTIPKCSDAGRIKMESWSEFASWNHLENSSPYW